MQAVILAGGLGTRLRQIVNDRPKPLAEICGKAFLEYQIEFLKKYHVKDIVICIGYLGEKIEEHFLDGSAYDVSIAYSRERDLLGTGGALRNAKDLLEQRFFVLNGDTLFLINLLEMKKFHEQHFADATIALTNVKDPSLCGAVILEKNTIKNRNGRRIIGFSEKSRSAGHTVNAGIYLMEKKLFPWEDLPTNFSLENNFLPTTIQTARILGFVDERAYFVDIGTIEGYRRLQEDIRSRRFVNL